VTAPASVQIRIGLATGLVVVGDLIGTGAAQEQAVVGETPYLAARLQSLAQPAALLIDANTRRLLGDLFEFHNLGAVEAKGFAGAVPACQVLRPSESRFEALRASSLTPLVGREEEIEFLLAAGPAPRKVMGRWSWSLASPALASADYRRARRSAARRAKPPPPLFPHALLREQSPLSRHCPARARLEVRTRKSSCNQVRKARDSARAERCQQRGDGAHRRAVGAAAP
jgi:hypothetical protein